MELKVIEGGKTKVLEEFVDVLPIEEANELEEYLFKHQELHSGNKEIHWHYVPFSRKVNPLFFDNDLDDNVGMLVTRISQNSKTLPYLQKILGDKMESLQRAYPFVQIPEIQQIIHSRPDKGLNRPMFSPRTTLNIPDMDYVTLYYFANDSDGGELVIFNERQCDDLKGMTKFTEKKVFPIKKNTAVAFYGQHWHSFVRSKSTNDKVIVLALTDVDYEKTEEPRI